MSFVVRGFPSGDGGVAFSEVDRHRRAVKEIAQRFFSDTMPERIGPR